MPDLISLDPHQHVEPGLMDVREAEESLAVDHLEVGDAECVECWGLQDRFDLGDLSGLGVWDWHAARFVLRAGLPINDSELDLNVLYRMRETNRQVFRRSLLAALDQAGIAA